MPSTPQPIGLVPSVPRIAFDVMFPVNSSPQSQSFTFTPVNDSVPNEPQEVAQLVFNVISDERVVQGAESAVVIIDDDALGGWSMFIRYT